MKTVFTILKRLFISVLVITILMVGVLYATDNDYILRGLALTYLKGRSSAGIYDYTDFDNNAIETRQPQIWAKHPDYNQLPLSDTLRTELDRFKTEAFLIIKDGKLLYEEYFNDRDVYDISNSFSMAKTYVTMLLFKAIENGDIDSLNQKIIDFLPEYKNDPFGKLCTIGDLSAMTSAYNWKENYYLPLNPTAKAYFDDDIEEQMLNRNFFKKPGGHFQYLSGNTQLLQIVLERATNQSLSEQLTEYFWTPLGMEQNALWSLDRNGETEKAYCCVNATARDFAKIGQLFLQQGNWNGRQLIDSAHVKKMVEPNINAFAPNEPKIYGYSVWTDYEHQPNFYAFLGHLGQRTIIIPEENLVIVRLGHKKDKRSLGKGILERSGTDIYYFVDEVVKMIENK